MPRQHVEAGQPGQVDWPPSQRAAAVLRLLSGEDVQLVAGQTGVGVSQLETWRERFIAGGISRLPDGGESAATADAREPGRDTSAYLWAAMRVAERISSRLDLDHVLDRMVQGLVGDFDAVAARVWLTDRATGLMQLRGSAGLPLVAAEGSRTALHAADLPYGLGRVTRRGRPIVRDVGDLDGQAEWLSRHGVSSVAAFPLSGGDEALGVLVHFSRDRLSRDVTDALCNLARMTGALLRDVALLDREREARSQAEAAQRRAAFLAEAGRVLASSLDSTETLRNVAQLVAYEIADWCFVDRLQPDGSLQRATATHADPSSAAATLRVPLLDAGVAMGPLRVVRTGEPELVPEITEQLLATMAADDERDLLHLLGGSYMCVPLTAHGQVLGTMSCVTLEPARRFGPADLALLQDLARSAATAIENATLYQQARAATEARDRSLALVDTFFANAPIGLAFWDNDLRFQRVNAALAASNGRSVDEHLSRGAAEVVGPLGEELEPLLRQVLETREALLNRELQGETPAQPGDRRSWDASIYPVCTSSGECYGVGAVIADTTQRRRAERALRESEERFRFLVDGVRDYALYMLGPDGRVESWNAGAQRLLGYRAEEILGLRGDAFYRPEDRERGLPDRHLQLAATEGRCETEGWRQRKDGTRFWGNMVLTALHDRTGRLRGFAQITQDVTERHEAQVKLTRQALHDGLTGLPNRTLLHDRLDQALRFARRSGSQAALLLMDLDRFKEINDTLGHQVGDSVLVQVAQRLRGALREADTVARLGGDEFAVLLPRIGEPLDAEVVAHKLREALEAPLDVQGLSLRVDASIGIAVYPLHGDTDELFQRADVAMYRAKRSGTGTALYAPTDDLHSPVRLAFLGELRDALDNGQLRLHYQPKLELHTGRVAAMEALVRWQHPDRGTIQPAHFIPLAEETGLIKPLNSWVLRTAARQCKAWRDEGLDAAVAVNLSSSTVGDAQLYDTVVDALDVAALEPGALELEIPEQAVLARPGAVRNVLLALHDLGVRLCIDDFGAGYSSLAYLRRLPVQEIKIDRSFVLDLKADGEDSVVRSVIELGHDLNLRVVAKGVESEHICETLRDLGCDYGQGFHLREPLPAAEARSSLREEGFG